MTLTLVFRDGVYGVVESIAEGGGGDVMVRWFTPDEELPSQRESTATLDVVGFAGFDPPGEAPFNALEWASRVERVAT